ncbi:MAG UNVERIFIED_CONTAM: Holliday junction resolvase RuvX [Anaerolineae bacterium]
MIGRLIGIDHGLRRIGVAVSDALGISARPLTIIKYDSPEASYRALQLILTQQQAVGMVIGLPYNESNLQQMHHVKAWTNGLQAYVTQPSLFWDEQLTSQDATEIAKQLKRKKEDPIDDLAAMLILQSYLNALQDGLAPRLTGA